jgi:transcriptional regulator with XRE-family HTH domain
VGITIQKELKDRLKDKEFAQEYGENIAKAEIAVAVTQARRSKNLTQEELANILSKSQSYVAKIESGDANPTIGNVGRILASIGVRISADFRPLSSGIENKEISFESVNSNENFYYWDFSSELEKLNNKTNRDKHMRKSRVIHFGRLWFTGQADEIGVASSKENVRNDKNLEYIWR